jgi:hypothetical protein
MTDYGIRPCAAAPGGRDVDYKIVRHCVPGEEVGRRPLCHQKRTLSDSYPMSALGHEETHALQQSVLFDHLVSAQQDRGRHRQVQRLCCLQIHDHLKAGRALGW